MHIRCQLVDLRADRLVLEVDQSQFELTSFELLIRLLQNVYEAVH